MNEDAPITWVINKINEIVSSGASAAADAIANQVAPLAAVCFGIYIILICVNYMRGAETEPVIDFGIRIIGFAIVIGLGLNAGNYSSIVIPIVTGLGSDLASAISGGTATANSLDTLALHYIKIIGDGFDYANGLAWYEKFGVYISVGLKTLIIIFGLVPFLVAAALCLIIADVGSVMVAMVGPIFFACLIFPATRQYFSAWVNTAFSYALIPLFVAVIATISIGLSKEMLSSGSNLDKTTFKAVILASMGNLILLFLLKQVSSLASSLSAGGINAGMTGSIGTLANSIRGGMAGTAQEIRGGIRAYQAGRVLASKWANRSNSLRKAG